MRLDLDMAGGIAFLTSNHSVFANGKLVMRLGDLVKPHGFGVHGDGVPMITASPSVFAEGIAVCGEGDLAYCQHVATGSNNVFVA